MSVLGLQLSDGTVERCILCDADTDELTAEQARTLAGKLAEAADALERLQ